MSYFKCILHFICNLPSHVILTHPVNIIHSTQHKRILPPPEINSNIGIKIWNKDNKDKDKDIGIKIWSIENLKNVDVLRYCVVAVSIF